MSLYEKWHKGETTTVRTLPLGDNPGGKVFQIEPYRWEGFSIGFRVLVDGKRVAGEDRVFSEYFTVEDLREWFALLEVVE